MLPFNMCVNLLFSDCFELAKVTFWIIKTIRPNVMIKDMEIFELYLFIFWRVKGLIFLVGDLWKKLLKVPIETLYDSIHMPILYVLTYED